MELNQIREKIEEIFPKYKHHWFELFEDGTTDEASERFLIGITSEEIHKDFNAISVLQTPNAMVTFIKKLITDLQKSLNDAKAKADSDFTYAIGKVNVESTLKQAERILGSANTRYQTKIDFWEWFLSEQFEQNKAVKTTNENVTPQTFAELFYEAEDIEATFKALQKLGIVNDENKWTYGSKKNAIMVVIDVLKTRNKIKILPDNIVAKLLAGEIGTSIGDRTTRDRPYYYEELKRDLLSMIPATKK